MSAIKKTILLCWCIILHGVLYAQITLTTGNGYLDKPAMITTESVKKAGVDEPWKINALSGTDRLTSFDYVDGFERTLQHTLIAATPAGKDLIAFSKYDNFGRQTKIYLPYQSTYSNGTYRDIPTAITEQASFYSTGTTANKIPNDTKPWSQSVIEESPLQRLLKQGKVGDGFQTDQNYTQMLYRNNESGDAVRLWTTSGTSSGTYTAGELAVTVATDADGVQSLIFTDKSGRTILQRSQADETINMTSYAYFDTYYVYDLAGNISYIVPPKAVARLGTIGGTWNVSSVPNLTFSYVYDSKNRAIQKKAPNADPVYMVYDPLDRIVLVQDGNMRTNNKWHYKKYDSQERTIIEGIYTDNTHTSLSSMQSYVDGLSCYSSAGTNYYEDRTNNSTGYTNNCFPSSNTEERLIYYFDDYDFDRNGSADYSYTSQSLTGEQSATTLINGVPTGVKKRILGTSNWLVSYTFYDQWYHPIQTITNNQLKLSNVTDIRTTVIDFAGRTTIDKDYKSHPLGSTVALTVKKTYTYDRMDRIRSLHQSINGGSDMQIAEYEYNSIGLLVDKKLQPSSGGSVFLQSVDLRYNVRGQLISINNSALSDDSGVSNDDSNDLFGMDMLYDQTDAGLGNTANYTGLLSAIKWRAKEPSNSTPNYKGYVFSYDKLDRLSLAAYSEKAAGGSSWNLNLNEKAEAITYDHNGNILSLQRGPSSGYMDNLAYDYGNNYDNNQLLNVTDAGSSSFGFTNPTGSSASPAYTYDYNGNLIADAKKGTSITYNEQNKPLRITKTSNGNYIEYTYDASGLRLNKTVYDGSTTKTITYLENIVIDENYDLSYFAIPEGRVRYSSSTFTYEYFLTDQLGNVRMSFEDNGSGTAVVKQVDDYYAFGMRIEVYKPANDNKRLYNAGSELQDDLGGIANYYSTFYREYDAVLGRFNSVDPMSGATAPLSVYHYSANNPVNFNDPNGDLYRDPSGIFASVFPFPLQDVYDIMASGSTTNWGERSNQATMLLKMINDIIRSGNLDEFVDKGQMAGNAVVSSYLRNGYEISKISYTWRRGKFGMWITTGSLTDKEIDITASWVNLQQDPKQQKSAIWYYMEKWQGGPHTLVYDAVNRIIYDINAPLIPGTNKTKNPIQSLAQEGRLALGYRFDMNNPEEANKFWTLDNGRGILFLSPVEVPNPAEATKFFESYVGKSWFYGPLSRNCKHFVCTGLRAGGADISFSTYGNPLPSGHPASKTMRWDPQAPGPVPYNTISSFPINPVYPASRRDPRIIFERY